MEALQPESQHQKTDLTQGISAAVAAAFAAAKDAAPAVDDLDEAHWKFVSAKVPASVFTTWVSAGILAEILAYIV